MVFESVKPRFTLLPLLQWSPISCYSLNLNTDSGASSCQHFLGVAMRYPS